MTEEPYYLSDRQVIAIQQELVRRFGGEAGRPDPNCVAAATALPKQSAFGEDAYPTMAAKAAVYMFYFAKKHCFPDGNKRTGAATALFFLRRNGWTLAGVSSRALEKLLVDVVVGACDKDQLTRWIERRLVPVDSDARRAGQFYTLFLNS